MADADMTEEEMNLAVLRARGASFVLMSMLDNMCRGSAVLESTVLCMMLTGHCSMVQLNEGHTMDEYLADHIESVKEGLADIEAAGQNKH